MKRIISNMISYKYSLKHPYISNIKEIYFLILQLTISRIPTCDQLLYITTLLSTFYLPNLNFSQPSHNTYQPYTSIILFLLWLSHQYIPTLVILHQIKLTTMKMIRTQPVSMHFLLLQYKLKSKKFPRLYRSPLG